MPHPPVHPAPATLPATAPPRIFCRRCGYPLVGLASRNCPECGRAFDSANPRTFARRGPRGAAWRWGRRIAGAMLTTLLVAGLGLAWLWRGWQAEQATIGQLRSINGLVNTKSIGPEGLGWVLGERFEHLRHRVDDVHVTYRSAAEIERIDFRSLRHLEQLSLWECELNDPILANVTGAKSIRSLTLPFVKRYRPNLGYMARLPRLVNLSVEGSEVRDADLAELSAAKGLVLLNLARAEITDAGLEHLMKLPSLNALRLDYTPVTDAGLKRLTDLRSLEVIWALKTPITPAGIAKAEHSNPDLDVRQ